MPVSDRHPEMNAERFHEWQLMRHAMEGESRIKAMGEVYLAKPSGFSVFKDGGKGAYEAYRMRADFPEIVAPTVAAMVGIVHAKETRIEMPPALRALMWENADGNGLTLEAFHRRITRHLLWLGRYGVLTDAPAAGGDPFLVGYSAETVINWDRDFFVLDESGIERQGFTWRDIVRYRVLEMRDGAYVQSVYEESDLEQAPRTIEPRGRGGDRLPRIPFVVASARDLTASVDPPPLVGVAHASVGIYQLSADYRYQLYMSGQETLVAINGEAPKAVGAGVVHEMRGADGLTPDLRYVSPSCSGIEAHKEAMAELRHAAVLAGARMFEGQRSQESGEARRLRFASETANLMSVALASAGLLERALRNAAMMMGLDETAVVVVPPSDLLDTTMRPQDVEPLVRSWQNGAISYQTLYENLQRGGIASPERDHVAETALISAEGVPEGPPTDAL